MSKLLSEEQIFEAFMSHIENVRHISLRKHLASPTPEIYVNQFLKGEYDAFKAAFTLLMPIIEKQADELGYYADPENWIKRTGEAWNKCCPKSKGDEEMIRRYKHPGKDWFGTVVVGGKRARQALQETKQMLEQLGEKK